MNATERRLGLASALSLKSQDKKIRILDSLDPKTSAMSKKLSSLEGTVLVLVTAEELKKTKGIRNISGTHVDVVTHASPAEILKYEFCAFTPAALTLLSSHFNV